MTEIISIELNEKQIIESLQKLAKKTSNLYQLMRVIAGHMADAVEDNFSLQGNPRWKDLAESTKDRRAKRGHWPGRILQESGQMAASVYAKASNDEARVGTNKKYAPAHQFGLSVSGTATVKQHSRLISQAFGKTIKPRKVTVKAHSRSFNIKLPARPFLKIDKSYLNMINKSVIDFIEQ